MDTTTTGQRIRNLRQAKGWTQAQLAEAAGMHNVQISQLETGASPGSLKSFLRLATALECTLDHLARGPHGAASGQDAA